MVMPFVGLFVQATACAFRFLRQPSRPIAPRPVANSGRAAGTGVWLLDRHLIDGDLLQSEWVRSERQISHASNVCGRVLYS
jgi:hypothetical protein